MFGRIYRNHKRQYWEEFKNSWRCCWAFVLRKPGLHASPIDEMHGFDKKYPGGCLWCGYRDDEFYADLEKQIAEVDLAEAIREQRKNPDAYVERPN